MEKRILEKVVFLDRDGTINEPAPEHQYIVRPEYFHLLPGAAEGIRLLRENGFHICVVTNQRGIARGLLSEGCLRQIHEKMEKDLRRQGASPDGIYYCPHEKGVCHCRKPDIGLFLQAEEKLRVDKDHSYMIGDSESDILAGKRYGVKTVYLGYGNPYGADESAASLLEAAEGIVKAERIGKRKGL